MNPYILAALLAGGYLLVSRYRRNPDDDDFAEEIRESIDAHELQALYADVENAEAQLEAAIERLGEHVEELAADATEGLED